MLVVFIRDLIRKTNIRRACPCRVLKGSGVKGKMREDRGLRRKKHFRKNPYRETIQ